MNSILSLYILFQKKLIIVERQFELVPIININLVIFLAFKAFYNQKLSNLNQLSMIPLTCLQKTNSHFNKKLLFFKGFSQTNVRSQNACLLSFSLLINICQILTMTEFLQWLFHSSRVVYDYHEIYMVPRMGGQAHWELGIFLVGPCLYTCIL